MFLSQQYFYRSPLSGSEGSRTVCSPALSCHTQVALAPHFKYCISIKSGVNLRFLATLGASSFGCCLHIYHRQIGFSFSCVDSKGFRTFAARWNMLCLEICVVCFINISGFFFVSLVICLFVCLVLFLIFQSCLIGQVLDLSFFLYFPLTWFYDNFLSDISVPPRKPSKSMCTSLYAQEGSQM